MACLAAYRSFPSGHSGTSFCALMFTTFVLLGQARLCEASIVILKGGTTVDITDVKIIFCLFPAAIAAYIAASRVHESDHHPADIVGGAVIGTGWATLFYRRHFTSIFSEHSHRPRRFHG